MQFGLYKNLQKTLRYCIDEIKDSSVKNFFFFFKRFVRDHLGLYSYYYYSMMMSDEDGAGAGRRGGGSFL